MKNSTFLNFHKCELSNDLWPNFVSKIGFYKAKIAVRQSLDLQRMQGNCYTVPVLILETCGSALVNTQAIQNNIGLRCDVDGIVLIYSSKLYSFQLLKDH